MAPEQTPAVLEEVPDDEDIEAEHDNNHEGCVPAEAVNFDRDEEGRFPNRQPAGPGNTETEADRFDEREEAIGQQAGGGHENFGLGELADLGGKMGPDSALRVEPQDAQQALVF